MRKKLLCSALALALTGCGDSGSERQNQTSQNPPVQTQVATESTQTKQADEFEWVVDRFADLRVLRYQVPGFEQLPLQQKQLLYFLSQAALAGRDMIWDQNYYLNLTIRRTLEAIVQGYQGDKSADLYQRFLRYTKQVWFANGIHHHYANQKFTPEFSFDELTSLANNCLVNNSQGVKFPLNDGETLEQLLARLQAPLFDPKIDGKKVNKAQGVDKVAASAVNFYRGLTEQEVQDYYEQKKDRQDATPISYGLNSQLVKQDGKIIERVWKKGGMYSPAIEQIVMWLEKASQVAENQSQKKAIDLLAKFYQTGSLKDFDEYSIAWVKDTESDVDVINGFIEVYNDPLAYRGSFESVVSVRNPEATKIIATIAENAQWFEDNAPMDKAFKKEQVKGITGKSIVVVMEAGDSSPSTPIGINLPNANWIRAAHGSKSVSLGNIVNAYNQAKGEGLKEFAWDQAEIDRAKQYGALASDLHTDMHEVIGHASGKINPGVGTPKETLKQYASTLEEARADLVGLFYVFDQKLIDIGVSPSLDVGKAAYDSYIRNGLLMQLQRIKLGDDIEEDHMRNRQLIANWVMEKGAADNVAEKRLREGKTYFVINDYLKLRSLFGQLLGEIQRIKSEGDYAAGEALVENYGVKVDPTIHQEVLARFEKLDVAPYSGFVNPILTPVMKDGEILDVKLEYAQSFEAQMLDYARNHSFLPNLN